MIELSKKASKIKKVDNNLSQEKYSEAKLMVRHGVQTAIHPCKV